MLSYNDKKRLLMKTALKFFQSDRGAEALEQYGWVFQSVIAPADGLHGDHVTEALRIVEAGKMPLHLLYVEDDREVAAAMTLWFQDLDCKVTHYTSAAKALHVLESGKGDFDAVLTDWNLIGRETGAPVAEGAARQKIPFRIYSGRDPEEKRFAPFWITKGVKDTHDRLEAFLAEVRSPKSRPSPVDLNYSLSLENYL